MASQVVRGVRRSAFGPAFKYTLVNASGASVVVTNYGATVLSIQVPDKEGKLEEVTVQRWSEARSDLDMLKVGVFVEMKWRSRTSTQGRRSPPTAQTNTSQTHAFTALRAADLPIGSQRGGLVSTAWNTSSQSTTA